MALLPCAASERNATRSRNRRGQLDAQARAFSQVQRDEAARSSDGAEIQFWRQVSGRTGEVTAEVVVTQPYGAGAGWAVGSAQVQLPDSVCDAADQRMAERIRMGDPVQ